MFKFVTQILVVLTALQLNYQNVIFVDIFAIVYYCYGKFQFPQPAGHRPSLVITGRSGVLQQAQETQQFDLVLRLGTCA